MSFPRAKIHRFNETKGCTPAPGSYNPKFDDKIIGIGAVIEKSQRFADVKNNAAGSSDLLNTSFSSGKPKATSHGHLPVFRTPQVPHKLKRTASSSKLSNSDSVKGVKSLCSESFDCFRVTANSKEDLIQELEYMVNQLQETVCDQAAELVKVKADRDEEVTQLKDKIFEITAKLAGCEALLSIQLTQEQVLLELGEDALQKLNSGNECMDSKLVQAEANCLSVTTQLSGLNLMLSDLRETQQELHHQIKAFQSQLAEKDRIIEVLKTIHVIPDTEDNASASVQSTELWTELAQETESVRKEVLFLEARNVELEFENRHLVTKYYDETLIRDGLSAKIDSMVEEHDILESVKQELKKQVAVLEEMDVVQKAQINHMREERMEFDFEVNYSKEMNQKKIDDLNRRISELTDMDIEHKQCPIEKNELVLRLENKLRECTDKIAAMEKYCQEIDQEKQMTIEEISISLHEHSETVGDLKNKVAEKQEMILMLQGELSEKEVQLEEVSADYLRVATTLQNERESLQSELSKYSMKIGEIERSQEQFNFENEERQKILEDNILNGSIMREGLESTLHNTQVELETLQERYNILLDDSEAKIEKQQKEGESKQNELMFELLETHAKLRLAECELEEVQSLLAKTKIECEANVETLNAERTALTFNRDELRVSNMEYQLSIVDLQDQLDVKTVELNASVKYFSEELGRVRSELQVSRSQCKRFEIGNVNLHESLVAVTQRLTETISDSQVQEALIVKLEKRFSELVATIEEQDIQLEQSLAALEMKNLHEIHEVGLLLCSKLNKLFDKLKVMKLENEDSLNKIAEKYETVFTDMGDEYRALEQLMRQVLQKHSTLQQSFKEQGKELDETKFDLLRAKDDLELEKKNIVVLEEKLDSLSTCHKAEIDRYTNRHKMPDSIQDVIEMLTTTTATAAEKKMGELVIELDHHNRHFHDLQKQLNEENDRILSQAIAENKIKDCQLQELRSALQVSTEENKSVEWESRYHHLAALVGPFRDQLEEFKAERHVLESRNEAAANEVKDLAQKYAQILGHQNHKQKIHHVVKLKELNLELKQDLEKSESDGRAKDKTIKKLKSELAALTRKPLPSAKSRLSSSSLATKGKENNDHSPARQSPNPKPFRELANC